VPGVAGGGQETVVQRGAARAHGISMQPRGGPARRALGDSVEVPVPPAPPKEGLWFCNHQFSLMNQVL